MENSSLKLDCCHLNICTGILFCHVPPSPLLGHSGWALRICSHLVGSSFEADAALAWLAGGFQLRTRWDGTLSGHCSASLSSRPESAPLALALRERRQGVNSPGGQALWLAALSKWKEKAAHSPKMLRTVEETATDRKTFTAKVSPVFCVFSIKRT